MKTKEEYYLDCLKNRELVKNPDIIKCTCKNLLCEWHGKCNECIALHRYYGDHLPVCLQPMIKNKSFEKLVNLVELDTIGRDKKSIEYYEYVRDQDEKSK